MAIGESQKVDLASQMPVSGTVHVLAEKRVGMSKAYTDSDVALSGLLLRSCQHLIPELYLFGGMGEKPHSRRRHC
jgi:hypothetical protein